MPYRKIVNWGHNYWQNPNNNSWAVYFYGLAMRERKNWKEAQRINLYANTLPEDDYYDRILLWKNIDAVIQNGEAINSNELSRIRIQELCEVEQYAYELLVALYAIQNEGGLNAAKKYVEASLQRAIFRRAETSNSTIGSYIKKSIKHLILNQVEGGTLDHLRWRVKLFHLM